METCLDVKLYSISGIEPKWKKKIIVRNMVNQCLNLRLQ